MTAPVMDAGLMSSLALVAMLGFRHGFDADHIAAVDGMTRARQLQCSYGAARRVGLQFALGHSAVIGVVSLLLYGHSSHLPSWLDGVGVFISSAFLLVIGLSNLRHALRPAHGGHAASPVAALLLRVSGGNLHPMLVGMAFAMSFDAMAQAAFFASRGGAINGMAAVALLAAAFGAGMVLADAANGALIAWCAARGDQAARQASRFISGFIAVMALVTVVAAAWRETDAAFAQAWQALGMWVGVGLMLATVGVFTGCIAWRRMRAQDVPLWH